jgi:hypothetical protein
MPLAIALHAALSVWPMLPRTQRVLRLALALALCLQASVALAHCLRNAATDGFLHALLMERCLGGAAVADTDNAAPPEPTGGTHVAPAFCPVCHGLPSVVLPVPATALQPHQAIAAARLFHVAPALSARAIGPPYASTGPPALS